MTFRERKANTELCRAVGGAERLVAGGVRGGGRAAPPWHRRTGSLRKVTGWELRWGLPLPGDGAREAHCLREAQVQGEAVVEDRRGQREAEDGQGVSLRSGGRLHISAGRLREGRPISRAP